VDASRVRVVSEVNTKVSPPVLNDSLIAAVLRSGAIGTGFGVSVTGLPIEIAKTRLPRTDATASKGSVLEAVSRLMFPVSTVTAPTEGLKVKLPFATTAA